MKRIRLILFCLLAFAPLSPLTLAQTVAPQAESVTVIPGDDLEESLENAFDSAVQEATEQLEQGMKLDDLITSPPFLMALFGLLGAVLTYFTTNGIKFSTLIKGAQTRLLAGLISILTAGVGGYFGLSEVASINGWEGAALAALTALLSFTVAHGAHETRRGKETGLRTPERKALREERGEQLDGIVEVLIAAGAAVGIPAAAIRAMYYSLGREAVLDLIAQTRALTEEETKADQDAWEKEQAARPSRPPAPQPSPG